MAEDSSYHIIRCIHRFVTSIVQRGRELMYNAAMSCLLLAQLSHPGSTIWARSNINVELAYWSTTIGTNILLTLLIVSHLLQMIYTARKVLGMTQVPYLTVSAILVEGAVLYSSFGLAFLILNALNNPGNVLFFSLLEQLQVGPR